MAKVRMLTTTRVARYGAMVEGSVREVSDDLAAHWVKKHIAESVGAETPLTSVDGDGYPVDPAKAPAISPTEGVESPDVPTAETQPASTAAPFVAPKVKVPDDLACHEKDCPREGKPFANEAAWLGHRTREHTP